jgi:hypothetical protein
MSLVESTQVLGNIGEFVGAIAVVATLIYLAIQVRQSKAALDANTNIAKASLSFEAARSRAEVNGRLADSPELLSLIAGTSTGDSPPLSKEEHRRLAIANRMLMQLLDADCTLYRNGLLEEDYWQTRLEHMKRRLSRPYMAAWWTQERQTANYSSVLLDELDQHPLSGSETFPDVLGAMDNRQ